MTRNRPFVKSVLRPCCVLAAGLAVGGCSLHSLDYLQDEIDSPDAGAAAADGSIGSDSSVPEGGSDSSVPEGGSEAGCVSCRLGAVLVHRYSFEGTGAQVTDSVGSAHGTVVNTQLSGSGTLTLAGGTSEQYVDLPNDILSGLTDATFETWITWGGGADYQRVFDFGSCQNAAEGTQGTALTALWLTPAAQGTLRAVYTDNRFGSLKFTATSAPGLPTGSMHHLAVVVNAQDAAVYLYRDGARAGQTTGIGTLSDIDPNNNWLGRSQYVQDAELNGTYHEFRIYAAALTAAELQSSFTLGPEDPLTTR